MAHYTVLKSLSLKRPQTSAGFSLIELLVVLIIAGIATALAGPSLKGWYDQQEVNNSITKIRTAIEQARSNAVRLSKSCTVTIPAASGGYYTVTGTPEGCVLENFTISSQDIIVEKGSGSLPLTLTFTYEGVTDSTTPGGTIIVSRKSGSSAIAGTGKCVVISPFLGMIRSGEYEGTTCVNKENLDYTP